MKKVAETYSIAFVCESCGHRGIIDGVPNRRKIVNEMANVHCIECNWPIRKGERVNPTEVEKALQADRERQRELEEAEKEKQRGLEEMKSIAFGKGIAFGVFLAGMIIVIISIFLGWPW